MHASAQERFKHCIPQVPTIDIFRPPFPRRSVPGMTKADDVESTEIPASNCRINITFRFYRPDFASSTTPRCRCDVPCILRPDMKGRVDRREPGSEAASTSSVGNDKGKKDERSKENDEDYRIKYWWTCYAGVQNDGKGCGMWKVMDVKAEGRGPFVGDLSEI